MQYDNHQINICKKTLRHLAEIGVLSDDSLNAMICTLRQSLKPSYYPNLLKKEKVIEIFDVTMPTLNNLIKEEKIPVIRFGGSVRIDEKDLIMYIEQKKAS